MQISELRDHVQQFRTRNHEWLASMRLGTIEPVDATWLDERGAPFETCHGVYFFVSRSGDVLYIGKAQEQTICERVWAHCQKPSAERRLSHDRKSITLYPNHRWQDAPGVPEAVRTQVCHGDFDIYGFEVSPPQLAGLLESVALASVWLHDRALPPLNATF